MGVAGTNQSDLFAAQTTANNASSGVLADMTKLTDSITAGTSAADLQKIQLKIQERQRALDAIKSAEEKLAKAAETINKFVQAQ
jgi:hypothetical protein